MDREHSSLIEGWAYLWKVVCPMRLWKASFAAIVVLAGLSTSASAQQFAVGGAMGSGFGPGQGFAGQGFGGQGFGGQNFGFGGTGFNPGFNSGFNQGFSTFGSYNPGFGGTGYGYGTLNYRAAPQTSNNMSGLMNSIRTQTGGGNSYRNGYSTGGRRR